MIQSKMLERTQLVLVVDDQEINRDILGMILEDDYDVIYADNGKEAMRLIAEHCERLSVILLDLVMPEMDGFEVLERVRNDERYNRIPVIVLTAQKDAELRALQMGASDFITKPFDMHEVILARVGRIIELSDGRQLISAAEHDQLTGLYSRNFFFEYAERIHRYHPEWQSDAIVLNIEKFHSINALNGREFGNNVLRLLGREILSFLAETEGIASRVEGDRFGIFCRHQDDYQQLLERFQGVLDGISTRVSIRLRMGVKPWEDADPVVLFDCARAACNKVRGDYKTHLMVYDDDMRKGEMLDQRLINDLRRAVEERELQVYYQPKYDIRCDPPKLASAEALIRWQHPELGMISPGVFIPLFEGNGQIEIVDNFVWSEAAKQVARWRERFGVTVPVSVNVSRADMFDPMLEEKFERLIAENGLEHECLKLEVTESAYTDNAEQMIDTIHRLREKGFQIEMDDFGSGYSSLNMLSAMPIDILKMDMRFIKNIEHSAKDFRLVKLVLDIAKYLGVPVVAEGVETENQFRLLREAGCDIIQGYYFSRPLPAREFENMIEKEKRISR
ncbi:MAG: EAL domain-containing protein [Oscillospiraceae bacterium]|nr:EAL domain-containing protein [Oscillospiraceae bacterium]